MKCVPYPQIHLRVATGEVSVIADGEPAIRELIAFLDAMVGASRVRSLFVKVGPANKCSTARLVMHRRNDGFVRVATRGDEAAVFRMLEEKWQVLRQKMLDSGAYVPESVERPSIDMHLPVRLDDTYRAVTKTAFNVLACDFGVDLALKQEFDELREYVMDRDVRHSEQRLPGEIAVDTRFVVEVPPADPVLVPTDGHAVTIFYDAPLLVAYVTLYERHSFFVRLGSIDLPDRLLVTHEFSTLRRGNAALPLATVYERIVGRAGGGDR